MVVPGTPALYTAPCTTTRGCRGGSWITGNFSARSYACRAMCGTEARYQAVRARSHVERRVFRALPTPIPAQ
eukprot:2069423-Rhodomonas_salina.2